MMQRRIMVVALFLTFSGGPVLAGPPLLTDDTGTPGDKLWEINIAYTLDKRHTESTHQTPVLDINYGIGDYLQLKYETPWIVLHERNAGTRSGWGNSLIGFKWRVLDEKRDGLSLSVYPQYEFNNPTSSADRGVVEEGTVMHLPAEISKRWGSIWANGELGFNAHQQGNDEWVYGVILGYDVRDSLALLGEIHGGSTKGFRNHEVVFNLGTQWDFSKRYGLLASAGRSFRNSQSDDPNLALYIGMQIRLGD